MRLAPTPENPSLEVKDPRVGCIYSEDKMSEVKTCSKCGETKPIDQFHLRLKSKALRRSWCHSCMNELHVNYLRKLYRSDSPAGERYRSHAKERSRIHHEVSKDPDHKYAWSNREANWKNRGIRKADGSPFLRADYHRLSELQGGVCALCGRHPPMWSRVLAVDHNAKTGIVRGLLCDECNHRAVGTFERRGRFTSRQDVNDLIRSYLSNPPASRLPNREEAEREPLPDTPVYSVITSPPKSAISWISAWTYTSTPVKETQA